jgi:hypothetical protein
MIIDNYFKFAIDNFLIFYNNLNVLGLILFYCFILLLVILIILLGILERNRHFDSQKNKLILPTIINKNNEDIEVIGDEHNKNSDDVKEIANHNVANIDSIAKKMEEDLGNKNIHLTDFEEDQEAKSIISYDELLEKTTKLKADDIQKGLTDNIIKKEIDVDNNRLNSERRFTNTPLISPVYGVKTDQYNQNQYSNKEENNNSLEKTLNMNTLSNEIKKNDEFLKALKDLKNKLN